MVHETMYRRQWLDWMLQIGRPVLEALAKRELKARMPVQQKLDDRPEYTYLEALGLAALIAAGTLFICGGIQGYQAGIGDLRKAGLMEWPLRVLLALGGILLATPGGGVLPYSPVEVAATALAILAPTAAVAFLMVRRRKVRVAP